jgi:hypothetical protein
MVVFSSQVTRRGNKDRRQSYVVFGDCILVGAYYQNPQAQVFVPLATALQWIWAPDFFLFLGITI